MFHCFLLKIQPWHAVKGGHFGSIYSSTWMTSTEGIWSDNSLLNRVQDVYFDSLLHGWSEFEPRQSSKLIWITHKFIAFFKIWTCFHSVKADGISMYQFTLSVKLYNECEGSSGYNKFVILHWTLKLMVIVQYTVKSNGIHIIHTWCQPTLPHCKN